MSLELAYADWTLTIQPGLGGSIAALRHRGVDVLRPAPPGATDPLAMGCFPLVPYVNRIGNGRFKFEGREHHLPRNAPAQAHPLHGVGWRRGWTVGAVTGRSATLTLSHAGGEHWPWRFAAEQTFALDDDGLHLTLSATNTDDAPMPCGLGFHPYFPAAAAMTLRFAAEAMWTVGDDLLPVTKVPADRLVDWSAGASVRRDALIDNSYMGWRGAARIEAADAGTLHLMGEGTPYLHIYMPPGADFVCAEPTSDMPDALNRTGPAIVLAPSETHRIAMTLSRIA